MKTVDFNKWKEERRKRLGLLVSLENKYQTRAVGRRPRDPEKERVLLKLDLARRAKYIETGKLEILGPRNWKWRIDFKKTEN